MEISSGILELKVISILIYGGYYVKYVVVGIDFEVIVRYKLLFCLIGCGVYGIVWLEFFFLSLKLFYFILFFI